MNILDQLADYARERVARDKAQVTLESFESPGTGTAGGGVRL